MKGNGEAKLTPTPGNGRPTESRQAKVYDELRDLARVYLNRQHPSHTLQPTALVHEAYLRLLHRKDLEGLQVGAFFAVAAKAMRSVLVDHARKRNRLKRGGGAAKIPLDAVLDLYEQKAIDLIGLDEALDRLAEEDEHQARVVELRFFGGLSQEETAAMLGTSTRTVGRLWNRARARLRQEMSELKFDDESPSTAD